jgi:hypothetical protein
MAMDLGFAVYKPRISLPTLEGETGNGKSSIDGKW